MDSQFDNYAFRLSEIEHHYGPHVHILSDPYLLTLLNQLCSDQTFQPRINELVSRLYQQLLGVVIASEFPAIRTRTRSRMAQFHPDEGWIESPGIDSTVPVVSVNLARAGTLPSHVCYSTLNYLMNPALVRQDHISIARTTNKNDEVTGSQVSGHKIGGTIDDSLVLFPDPMGATGSTIVETIELYKKYGKARKFIAMHCIITPEYIKNIHSPFPDTRIYAIRLDRGLSKAEVLRTPPGTRPEEEKGLNEKQYIVPGGGGIGEILNNSFV